MQKPWIPTFTTLLIACWGPAAAAQAPAPSSALERIASELQLLRQLVDRQLGMSVQLELLRAKVSRLGDVQRRLDNLCEERETEERLLGELQQSRHKASEEDRPGIDQNIMETGARIAQLRRREAALQVEIDTIERTLEAFFRTMQPAAVGRTP